MTSETIIIASTYEEVRIADEALRAVLIAAHIPDDIVGCCELALHELLVNLVDHAYNKYTDQSIEITLTLEAGMLIIQTVDFGKSAQLDLDSISMPEPVDLAESGYGMAIIQSLVDNIEYQNIPVTPFGAGQNVWTLRKRVANH